MLIRCIVVCTLTILGALALQGTSAHAISRKECGAKYKAAKEAGTLNGMRWTEFRKAQCSAAASATDQAKPPRLIPHSGGGH
jgi:hypothetical protein